MTDKLLQLENCKKPLPAKVRTLGWILTLIGALLIIFSYLYDFRQTTYNNVIGFLFLTSVAVGALFFIAIEYITGAVWSVPVRRVFEFLSGNMIFIPLLALPVLLKPDEVFHWIHPELSDELLANKAPYLNMTFFIIRFIGIIFLWNIFSWLFNRNSLTQDIDSDQLRTRSNIHLSAVFIPIMAVTLTITAIDWAMSLEPHWYSTIFGVYFFSGTVLAAVSTATYIIIRLYETGYFQYLKRDHFYSLGALLFAFVNFWAYIAFSQFLLIWYANLPEETNWFISRWQNGMEYVSVLLIIIHFVVPYFILLPQDAKMDPKRLKFISIFILIAHYLDLYWLVMPSYKSGITLTWKEFTFPVFLIGIIILVFEWKIRKHNLIPVGDPKLSRGINFRL